jgi:hypothetical protein
MTERQLAAAVRRYANAREKRDEAIVSAAETMSLRQIARVAELSPTRIAQIVREGTT